MKLSASAEAYVAHLQAAGNSPSTCATTKRVLALFFTGARIVIHPAAGS